MLIHTCHAHSTLCHGLEKSLSERHGLGMGTARVNQTWPHCVKQTEKTQSKPLAVWHGMGERTFKQHLIHHILSLLTKKKKLV
jgi:hypothetical protein